MKRQIFIKDLKDAIINASLISEMTAFHMVKVKRPSEVGQDGTL